MPQNSTNWTPTPKQAAVLEAGQEAGLNHSISAICEAAGVDRKSFYNWINRDQNFKTAWENIWAHSIRRHMPGVVAAMIAKAQDGDVPAARLVADLAGVTRQRLEAAVTQNTTLSVKEAPDITIYLDAIADILAQTAGESTAENEEVTDA